MKRVVITVIPKWNTQPVLNQVEFNYIVRQNKNYNPFRIKKSILDEIIKLNSLFVGNREDRNKQINILNGLLEFVEFYNSEISDIIDNARKKRQSILEQLWQFYADKIDESVEFKLSEFR